MNSNHFHSILLLETHARAEAHLDKELQKNFEEITKLMERTPMMQCELPLPVFDIIIRKRTLQTALNDRGW